MDRRHGRQPPGGTGVRRKLSIKSTGNGPSGADQKDSKPDRKVDRNSNIQQPSQQQYPSNFASVHRAPRPIGSIAAAIKRTAGQHAMLELHRDFPATSGGLSSEHQQHKSRQFTSKGGGTSVYKAARDESRSKVATLTGPPESARFVTQPENNGRIFNQPSLPLPVQIPNPYAAARHPSVTQQQQQQRADYLQRQAPPPTTTTATTTTVTGSQRTGAGALPGAARSGGTATVARQQPGSAFELSALPATGSARFTPKLLNEIYEKHLLSQTTFDGGPALERAKGSTLQPKAAVEAGRTLTKSDTRLRASPGTREGGPPKDGSLVVGNHNYDRAHRQDNGYESVRSNYHIYEKIDSRRASLGTAAGPPVEHYVRPVAPFSTGSPPPPLYPRPKSHPAAALQLGSGPAPARPVTNGGEPVQIATGSASLSPIHERPPLPVNPGRTLATQRSGSFTRTERINIALETAKAIATAAYIERAAQRLASGGGGVEPVGGGSTTAEMTAANGAFCGAIQRTPPPIPAGLARRMANRENVGLGKVKVMLRVSDDPPTTAAAAAPADQSAPPPATAPTYLTVDKKKRQVTLTETTATSAQPERGPMVSAPKMFAFDALFTTEDSQQDICGTALSEVIPAVLEGSDGCLLSLGYPGAGQSRTMFGTVTAPPGDLGAIPCAISWLYKGINEKRQKSGARFSVRVSALGVNATKPGSSSRDLLAGHATESDDSPGMYLRGDFLGRPTELRAPNAERAALFLDLALSGRSQCSFEPALIYTLHVYQYSLSGKRGVEGGRSRLHLIDLGGCANRTGGLPLSGIGNVLLAILSGQKHPPNRDHPLTPLLRDCLAPITCHVAVVAHVSHSQTHADTLTTIQLASRIHRMRRRLRPRNHLFGGADKGLTGGSSGHQSGGSSEGPDPSSSDFSQDTVIYMGPCDDPTDGEHPPVYLPSLNSGDNRCAMNKVLKGSVAEKPTAAAVASPKKKTSAGSTSKATSSPVPTTSASAGGLSQGRTDSLKRGQLYGNHQLPTTGPELLSSAIQLAASQHGSPKLVAGAFKHVPGVSKGSNIPTPKGSPMRRPAAVVAAAATAATSAGPSPMHGSVARDSPSRQISEEKWIDGPRVSKSKVHEARHLLREINHVKKCETWVDGPRRIPAAHGGSVAPGATQTPSAGQTGAAVAAAAAAGYGFMDTHKKNMIRQWVENQSIQLLQQSLSANSSPMHTTKHHATYSLPKFRPSRSDEDGFLTLELERADDPAAMVNPIALRGFTASTATANISESHVRTGLKQAYSLDAEPPPAACVPPPGHPVHPSQHQHPAAHHQPPVYASVNTAGKMSSAVAGSTSVASVHDSNHSERSRAPSQASDRVSHAPQEEEDQDSGPSEVPPALPLMDPLGSREISHESIHMLCSRHASRDDAMSVHSHTSHHTAGMMMMDCGLQVTEDEIAKAMKGEHPLSALSHGELSVVSSFNVGGGDVFSDCVIGDSMRSQFDQLARLREIFTSQLAMAEVTPSFRLGDTNSVYSEPAYRFNAGPGSVCSEPAYRPPSPRCRDCRQSLTMSRTPSQSSLPSLTGIVAIAGMEQYASLRHPDGASDPNLPKLEKPSDDPTSQELRDQDHPLHIRENPLAELLCRGQEDPDDDTDGAARLKPSSALLPQQNLPALPLLPISTPEAYDSGHDSTPRTSKHSGISRRAESGYHSVGTVRDSDESSFGSAASRAHQKSGGASAGKKRHRPSDNKSLCHWLRNPFNCTYPDTEGEISDF
ncbi:kinesin-like protein CG14535 [Anopheles cruzii]|uniref:kinesin-like protein CG14535 n=1 Tax=Anopheles cruzii TaxID=68878 RepID=UPI0022EC879C|nr:kinesin-like protein CG14535 [Anopheles cruzii]